MRALFAILASLAALFVTSSASAHLMAAGKGTVSIDGSNAYVVLSLPVSAFPGVDDDDDGRVDAHELERHAREVATALEGGLSIESGSMSARRATLDFTLSEHEDGKAAPSTHLVVIAHFVFASTPSDVTLKAGVLARAPSTESVDVRAHRGKETDHVVLAPERTARAMFRPATEDDPPGGARRIVFVVALAGFVVSLLRALSRIGAPRTMPRRTTAPGS